MRFWSCVSAVAVAATVAACSGSGSGEVSFDFPVRDRADVKGLVAFGAYGADNPHNGIDFRPFDHLERMEIVAPASGRVTESRVVEFGGLQHVQVDVSVDSRWGYALVFEPMTLDEELFGRQVAAVSAKAGDRLAAGEPVGALLLGGTDGPPTVHFLATRGRRLVCPYNHSTVEAQADYAAVAANGTDNLLPGGKFCVVDELP